VRFAGTVHAERAAAPGRDPIDLYAALGVSCRVAAPLRIGVEYLAQELEDADGDALDAEGGVRQFIGPDLALTLADRRLALTAGTAFEIGRPQLVGRAALIYYY
jgi:hypothetical protein